MNCLQFFTVNYMQYGSCGITARSVYNLTYSAYSVNVQRNSSEQIVERSGLALFDEGDDEAAMRSGP